jgi:hypothetical protein
MIVVHLAIGLRQYFSANNAIAVTPYYYNWVGDLTNRSLLLIFNYQFLRMCVCIKVVVCVRVM